MPQPDPYDRLTRFTGSEAGKATALLGVNLDKEFDEANLTVRQVLANLALIQRDDGKLANKSVHPESLDDATLLLIDNGGFRMNGSWFAGKVLTAGDIVLSGGVLYMAVTSHTAADITADKAAGKLAGPVFDPNQISNYAALLAGSSGSALVGFVQSGTGALARTVQDKLRDVVDARDFGVKADGTTDDAAALSAAFSAAVSAGAELRLPPGRIALDSAPTAPTGSITVRGGGPGVTTFVIRHAGARALRFAPLLATSFVELEGFSLEAAASSGPCPLGIEVTFPSTSSYSMCQVRVSNLRFVSDPTATSAPYPRTWGRAFKFSNVWNAEVFDITGSSSVIPGDTGNTGFMEAAGGSYGMVAASINRIRWYYGADLFRGTAYVEGIEFSQSEAVGVTRGIYVPSSTPVGGAGGIYRSQSIWMRSTHIAAHTAAADLDNSFDFYADSSNVQRWADASATNWTGYRFDNVQRPNIVGGTIAGNEASGGISTTGILATGANSAHGIVSGVVFENLDVQFNLGANTSSWSIDGNRSTGATADTWVIDASSLKNKVEWLNSDGTITYRSDQLSGPIMTGAYTPTLTGVANVTTLTPYQCRYTRVGNMVTISGRFDLRPTSTGVYTRFGLSLPVASTFSALEQCCGTAGSGTQGIGAQIVGDTVNGRAEVQVLPNTNVTHGYSFMLHYQII